MSSNRNVNVYRVRTANKVQIKKISRERDTAEYIWLRDPTAGERQRAEGSKKRTNPHRTFATYAEAKAAADSHMESGRKAGGFFCKDYVVVNSRNLVVDKPVAKAIEPKAKRALPVVAEFTNWPLVFVIHVNAFTRKIEGGYVMRHGVKEGATLPARVMLTTLAANPETPVEFLKV